MDFLEYASEEKEKVDSKLRKFFSNLIRDEKDFYLKDFFVRLRDFVNPKTVGGGPAKRIRPQVMIYTFFGIASDEKIEQHLEHIRKLCLSIELLHNASIIHDDVVDQDPVRRGLPTFHRSLSKHFKNRTENNYIDSSQWGNGVAIHGGDICAFLGSSIIMESNFKNMIEYAAMREYNHGFNRIMRGKIIEHYLMTNSLSNSTLEDYLMMAEAKTSTQFETAASIGAICADARISQLNPLRKAMNYLGVAYHIKNDIRDTFEEQKRNIILKKRNILIISAYKNAKPGDKAKIDDIFSKSEEMTLEESNVIREIIKESGALDFAKVYAQNQIAQAKGQLEHIYPGFREQTYTYFDKLFEFSLQTPISHRI